MLQGNRIEVFAAELEVNGFGVTSGAAREVFGARSAARTADLAIGSCIREALRPP